MPNAYISGVGGYVPPRVVTNDDLIAMGVETTDAWIQQRTGIRERRFADDGVGNADLALPAARAAIDDAGLAPTDIDMILYATLSPDQCFPGSGVMLAEKLGLCAGEDATFVPAMDIRNQCSGFVYGLGTAASLIQSGACQHVLVVGSEVHSGGLDFTTRGRTVASLFGDGAGAAVFSATEEDRGVRYWKCGSDGRFADVLCQRIFDISRRPFIPLDDEGRGRIEPADMWAHMDGRQVFRHAIERMSMALIDACQDLEITGEDVDLFLFHQANMRINQYLAKSLGIPEDKLVHNIDRYGNTTAATIPLLMAEAVEDGRLVPGMKVAAVAFGSGFTWGAAIVDW
ncbi:MAG TPA: beta-ketoacyl-ACP synthase III [Myxococcota bacterium]|nr:beta-ketoacyl-ACP synthase III [Myxococcota bacterium]